jgi:regulator of protease activity HflC (stomatin/prohibitin superfamily)
MQIVFSVPQGHVVVLTRFGKFARVLYPGLHSRIIFLEKVYSVQNWGNIANKNGYLIEVTEQITDTKPKLCHSKDNVPIQVDASIYWRITDVGRALFAVDNLPQSLFDTCLNALRSEIGKLSLDEVLSSRKELSERVAAGLLEVSVKWGVEISRVEIQELKTTDETADAMQMQMAAERKRRAMILEAEGIAEAKQKEADAVAYAKRMEAEADAFATRVRAEAEAEYVRTLSESIGVDEVSKLMMLDKVLAAYRTIANDPSSKVFLPSNIQSLITDVNVNRK